MQSLFKPFALLAVLAVPATAQTVLSGSVYDGNGGPLLAGQVYHTTGFTVPGGQTLTLEPGAFLKVDGGNITLFGTFVTSSTTDSAYVTSLFDDVFGGDSNGDGGATSPAPGDWGGFRVLNTGSLDLDGVEIRWGGGGAVAPVRMEGGTLELRDCVIQRALEEGIDLNRGTPSSVVTAIDNCAVIQCGTVAIDNAAIDDIPRITLLESLANNGDYVRVTDASLAADATISTANLANLNALVFAQRLSIPAGLTLTLEPGVVVKFEDSVSASQRNIDVSGTLHAHGTRANRVVFTSFADDEHGADTNEDGASAGSPGDWGGLRSLAGGLVDLKHALVRFGGNVANAPPVMSVNNGGDVHLRKVVIEQAASMGMTLGSGAPIPDVQLCTFRDNGTYPIDTIDLVHVQGFRNNEAMGNGTSDAMHVTRSTNVTSPVTIGPDNYPGPALILLGGLRMINNAPFTAMRGTILKVENGTISTDGPFRLEGTAFEPVIITSILDDSVGGDTNKDGNATTPSAGDWSGILVNAGVASGTLEYVHARYGDSIINHSPNVTIRSVRTDYAFSDGFQLFELDGDAVNLVAYRCGDDGIELRGGNFDIVHATLVENIDYGLIQILPHSGDVHNTISWGNTGVTTPDPDYFMQVGNTVNYSNGVDGALGNNNLDADPDFVDQAGGNLRLQPGSPCIDVADFAEAAAVILDHEEFSRLLDPTLSGNLRADMGAYEHARWRMSVKGRPHIGSTMILEMNGPRPATASYYLGFFTSTTLTDPFGYLVIGMGSSLKWLGYAQANEQHLIHIPFDPALVGLEFGIQSLTRNGASPFTGEMTNVYRGCFLPLRPGKPRLLITPPELSGGSVVLR